MTDLALRPIDMMTADWRAASRTAESREALARLADAEEVVAALGATDLGELVAALSRPGHASDDDGATALDRDGAAIVLRAMVRSQGVHPLVPRAILQALMPGLVAAARRLSWGSGGDWQAAAPFLSDVVATAWELIVEWAGQDRDYAVLDLLSAVRCRIRRQMVRQRVSREHLALGLDPDAVRRPQWTDGTTDLDVLAREIVAARRRGLEHYDAAVLYGNRVLGIPVAELARMTGRSARHVAWRRDRAVRQVLA